MGNIPMTYALCSKEYSVVKVIVHLVAIPESLSSVENEWYAET